MRFGARQFALVVSFVAAAAELAAADPRPARGLHLPLAFERNVGQVDPAVAFVARGKGYAMFLTAAEARFSLDRSSLTMRLLGANGSALLTALERLPGTANYFVGSDVSRWRTGIPTYARVRVSNAYPGIDVVYYGSDGSLEYDFELAPGANPALVRLAFDNARGLRVAANGDLVMRVDGRDVRQRKPTIYQDLPEGRRTISGRYVVRANGVVGFAIGRYDRSRALVIDPVLVYSSYLGGAGEETQPAVAVDISGSVYLAGATTSLDFPARHALQPSGGGGESDAFVTKVDPTGSFIVYSTYLGGGGRDQARGIAVDPSGFAYVAGGTQSLDFPTRNAFQPANSGIVGPSIDGFVAKLAPDTGTLVYSTYLGGLGYDEVNGIAATAGGDAIAAGSTQSSAFPVAHALQPVRRGPLDAFVTRISASGSSLVFSTHLGGTGVDAGLGVAADPAGNVYIAGSTNSPDFPVANAYQRELAGGENDAFVAKLRADGAAIVYGTYLGGSQGDFIEAIAAAPDGRAVVCGATVSNDFPIANASQPDLNGFADAFVVVFAPVGSTVVYSTYLGGSDTETCLGSAIDREGHVHVTGRTDSSDYPLLDAIQPLPGGMGDAFVTKMSPTGFLLESTYLGGALQELGQEVAVDASGAAYVTGDSESTDFPVTPGAFQPTSGGTFDIFVTKIGVVCGPEVTSDLDIATVLSFRIPLTPLRIELTLLHNHSASAIGGPLTFVTTQSANGILVSATTTSCVDNTTSPFTIVVPGSDGVLSPGEVAGKWLLFYEPGNAPVTYTPRVLSGVPGR